MRFLGIDLGDRRTGLAVGDDVSGIVTPVGVLEIAIEREGGGALLSALSGAVAEHLGPGDEVVIGLPLNMDGTEGPRAKQVRAFGARLEAGVGRPVRFHDERLSTVAADWSMARTGMTHKQKKGRRDTLAAAVVVRDFLAARTAGGHAGRGADGG